MYGIKIEDSEHGDFSELALTKDALELAEACLAEGMRELGHYAAPVVLNEVKNLLEGVRRLL